MPLTPFYISTHMFFLLLVQHSLFYPDALCTYQALLAFGPFHPCSRFSPILLVHLTANIPSAARDSWCQAGLELYTC